ncbi:MAG TPA: type II secretion system protein [Candidatus Paceibacterota bacterium]|nr:type II secretion system protein [Candidatus Paceibacterota bacterium]
MESKGFTLIELLVVIAILAVLAVAVTLILNPAQLVRQGRDSTRMSDLAAVHRAIGLYLADRQEVTFSDVTNCTAGGTAPTSGSCTEIATTTVDSNGWVPIDFTAMSTGAPLSRLPLDPVNSTDHFYVFDSNEDEEYELNAAMESNRYSSSGPADNDDVESTDGGDNDDWYEIGNDSDLNL